jgi:GDPmannose 4,6-dehydratase
LVLQEQDTRGEQIRFVQASSAEIFVGAVSAPQDETTPISPRSPYGASKAFVHLLVQVYRRPRHARQQRHPVQTRVASATGSLRTRKISSTVAAMKAGAAEQLQLGNLDACRD